MSRNRLSPLARLRRSRNEYAGDDDAPLLTTYVRLPDLEAAGIVRNWTTLTRLIREDGFPTGIMLGRKTRAWPLHEVEAWLAHRPTANANIRVRGKRASASA